MQTMECVKRACALVEEIVASTPCQGGHPGLLPTADVLAFAERILELAASQEMSVPRSGLSPKKPNGRPGRPRRPILDTPSLMSDAVVKEG